MRVQTEVFIDPKKEQTVLCELEKTIWVNPILGINREQMAVRLDELGLRSEPVCLFLNPIDPDLLQGILFLDKKIGIFDYSLRGIVPCRHGITLQRKPKPDVNEKSLMSLQQALEWTLKMADQKMAYARNYSDKQRSLLSKTVKEEPIGELKESLIDSIKHHKPIDVDSHFVIHDSSYGAFTSKGPRYLTYPLDQGIKTWIILKGHAEREISKLIYELKDWADAQDLPNKIDRCPLYSNEIDRLLLPTLETGIIDGNAYHPFEPVYPGDRVWNVDDALLNQELLYYNAPELKEFQARYKQKMRQGTLHLQEAANDLWALIQLYEPLNLQECLTS